jgi:hypothetical protein
VTYPKLPDMDFPAETAMPEATARRHGNLED